MKKQTIMEKYIKYARVYPSIIAMILPAILSSIYLEGVLSAYMTTFTYSFRLLVLFVPVAVVYAAIGYFLKVPHHGSRHNLTTEIIDALKPRKSYISAAGTKKHPNNSVVYWLSKYGDVYSTHACSGYIHSHVGMDGRPGDTALDPLKKKQ